MKTVGLDLHKVNSQVCVLDEQGEVEREVRVATDRKHLAKVSFLKTFPPSGPEILKTFPPPGVRFSQNHSPPA